MIPKRIRFYFYLFITFSAVFSCQKNTVIEKKETYNKIKVTRLIALANTSFGENKLDSAFYYYNEALSMSSPSKDPENYISTLNYMAIIQQKYGDYAGSETTLTQGLPYVKFIKDPLLVWTLYTTLGNNFLNTFDNKSAILYYEKTLKLNIETEKKLISKNSIGIALIQSEKFNEALTIFLPLENTKEVIINPKFYGSLLDNIGLCYFKINNNQSGLDYMLKGLAIKKKLQNPDELGKSYLHLAQLYESKNSSLSKKYAILSYKEFSKTNLAEESLTALRVIIKHSSDEEFKTYSESYISLNDSIYITAQRSKNNLSKIKYNSKREKEENLKLKTHRAENELKVERQKNKNIIAYITIVLSLCMILILYYYLTSKANREKIEATYDSETRISKKLHDELANDIYHTMAFAENKNLSQTENKQQLLNHLDAIYSRTKDISKENPAITTENYITSLKEMLSGFSTLHINLILTGLDTIDWSEVDQNKKSTVYRVLQELLVNMRKYSEASLVGISFTKDQKNILINYADNGKGIDTDKIIFKNGLYNVKNRIHKIKGQINISSSPNQGFKVSFKFPLS
ncbi:tetratricopeptide repeat-containing sensor histidine kinase [Flavobacterium panacagri]|uniref:tetratricopeptide repeat-containing sensor histidine kinase n=1 Tax=Flavobacterium panacagri TaxID=3034146 RepID=UPI0025A5D2B1|nr:ATP-binding protein [Flavobacterium panacagri]